MTVAVGTKVGSAAKFLAGVLAMIAGITKDFTPKMSLLVGGVSMTQAQILAQLAAIQALFSNAAAAKNALLNAVKAKDAGTQAAKQFMVDLKKAVEVQFGSNGPQLTDFGIQPPKPKAPRTAAEKAASAALAAQTRIVHKTMGKVQKADVTVTGKPGVVVLGPTGAPLVGVTAGGPIAPAPIVVDGASNGAAATPAPAGSNGATPAPAAPAKAGS